MTAPRVAGTARPPCPLWPHRAVTPPIVASLWRCGWWARTVCPPGRRVGTAGAITASASPLRQCSPGGRLGEKKAQARMDTACLDWALADVAGYVAADEVYDGPCCMLSAVDNRRSKRLLYDVLDHA